MAARGSFSAIDWRAAFSRHEQIASHGADCAMPSLLKELAAPDCPKARDQWDRCGAHYAEPVEGAR